MEDLTQVYLEIYKGRHGQSDAEYQAGRSDAGKRISGDENTGPRHYTLGRARGAAVDPPTAPGARPVNTPKLSGDEKEYHQYNKSGAKRRAEYNKVGGSKGLPGSVNAGYEPEDEMVEAWYSGQSGYRTTASGRRVMRDEPDEAEQLRQSDEIARNPKVRAERNAAARARLKAKGKVPTRNGKPVFEAVVEYLYVEGYADTIEAAELMAENIGDLWADSILEAVDWDKSDIGHTTGGPVPKKKMSPAKRHEFEKTRRENLKKQPGTPGDSPLIQALRQKAKDTGNYAN